MERAELELSLLNEISRVLGSTLDLHSVFDQTMRVLADRLGMERGSMILMDDATGKLRGAGGWGFVSAIASSYSPSPRSPLPDGLYPLPTVNWLAGGACAGVGLDAVLRGSPSDPQVAWLESSMGGTLSRRDVTWPAGYHARFTPNIEILDENGSVVLRDGDHVEGACGYNPDTGWTYLEPPFK